MLCTSGNRDRQIVGFIQSAKWQSRVTRTALSLAINRLVARGEIVHPGRSRFVIRGIV